MRNIPLFSILAVLLFMLISASCDEESNENNNGEVTVDSNTVVNFDNPLSISIDKKDDEFVLGDIIKIKINVKELSENDTIQVIINDKELVQLSFDKLHYTWDSKNAKTGTNTIEVELERNGNRFDASKKIIFYSDIEPVKMTYEIVQTFKHDEKAFTQGLFYVDGFLYEATGLKGESTVRKVKLETGEVIQSFAIPTDVFGEGIVLYDNKIIQLSWEAGRGFVYDFETFKLLDEFTYEGEGWGLCTDGELLFMSNGSHIIKILETDTYSQINSLEVYDNEGLVKYINEMEYINGYIYANIYQYEKIIKIDPVSGKVLETIDFKGILPMKEYTSRTDVFNGIAYDEQNDRIFVTGKNWPKLFEVKIKKK